MLPLQVQQLSCRLVLVPTRMLADVPPHLMVLPLLAGDDLVPALHMLEVPGCVLDVLAVLELELELGLLGPMHVLVMGHVMKLLQSRKLVELLAVLGCVVMLVLQVVEVESLAELGLLELLEGVLGLELLAHPGLVVVVLGWVAVLGRVALGHVLDWMVHVVKMVKLFESVAVLVVVDLLELEPPVGDALGQEPAVGSPAGHVVDLEPAVGALVDLVELQLPVKHLLLELELEPPVGHLLGHVKSPAGHVVDLEPPAKHVLLELELEPPVGRLLGHVKSPPEHVVDLEPAVGAFVDLVELQLPVKHLLHLEGLEPAVGSPAGHTTAARAVVELELEPLALGLPVRHALDVPDEPLVPDLLKLGLPVQQKLELPPLWLELAAASPVGHVVGLLGPVQHVVRLLQLEPAVGSLVQHAVGLLGSHVLGPHVRPLVDLLERELGDVLQVLELSQQLTTMARR